MEQIARVMGLDYSLHESERDVFVVKVSSFDEHDAASTRGLYAKLGAIDSDLADLHTDLTAMNKWNATTIISISDFGRTLSSNGIGTDHAWAGNMFMAVSFGTSRHHSALVLADATYSSTIVKLNGNVDTIDMRVG